MKQTSSIFLHYESSVSITHSPGAKCEDKPILALALDQRTRISHKEITQILGLVVGRGLTLSWHDNSASLHFMTSLESISTLHLLHCVLYANASQKCLSILDPHHFSNDPQGTSRTKYAH